MRFRLYIILLLAGLLVVLFSGCGEMEEGTIISKRYEPPETYTIYLPITIGQTCYTSGGSTYCNPITMPFPYTVHDGEDFVLRLRNDKGDTGVMYVDKPTWDKAQEGQFISRTDDPETYALDDTTLRKERQ